MGVLIAVARADMILVTAGRVLRCLLAGAAALWAVSGAWRAVRWAVMRRE